MFVIDNDWKDILNNEFSKEYYKTLREFLKYEYSNYTIYPEMNNIFNAFRYTSYSDVKIVILGQDPYHEPNQAHGLAFSVMKGVDIPPSLVNIYKEQKNDLSITQPKHGYLVDWAKQGVFLLNTALTVRNGQANSHKGKGWEIFTDNIIKVLNQREKPMVFMLWGANARSKAQFIDTTKHKVLQSPHPSPLSAFNGFFGCKHFSKANEFLISKGFEPINWQLEE